MKGDQMFTLFATTATVSAVELFTSGFMLGMSAYTALKETQKSK